MYRAMQTVSRELTGAIAGVTLDARATGAAKDQTIRAPIAPAATLEAFTPAVTVPNTGAATYSYVDMTLSKSYVAPIPISGEEEMSLGDNYQEIMQQNFAQAFRAITNQIETDLCLEAITNASRAYGTSGTTPFASSLADAAQIKCILDDNGAPGNNDPNYRSLIINSAAGVNLRSLANLMTANSNGSDQTLRNGFLLPVVGFGVRESNGIATHTKGTATGFQSNGAFAVGDTTLAVDGSDSGTILAGDVFSFGTAETSTKYVVISTTASGAAAGNVLIAKPGIRAAHADNDEITIANTYTGNFGFSRNALVLATRPPARPMGGDGATDVTLITDPVTGLTFSVARYNLYGMARYQVELVWGYKAVQPEHIAILLG
jgi:hypothetical protein